MIQLYINNILAVIKKDSSFKLNLENQIFTNTSSFSFEIELPMNIKANIQIFGALHRKDVAKKRLSFPARLIADCRVLLTGTATVTSVDESSVKVQLLGESAKYKYGNNFDKIYIDELPLGDWYIRSFGWYPGSPSKYKGSSYAMMTPINVSRNRSYEDWKNMMFNDIWVAYPIYNNNAETICNEYVWRTSYWDLPYTTPEQGWNGAPQMMLSIQPFVWYMCHIIAEATGVVLDIQNNYLYQNDFFRRIFIANANINIECNKCLPHWTVNEWWDQIEKTFGVKMLIDDITGKMILYKYEDYLNIDKKVYINAIDEYSVELNDSTKYEDSYTQNVGFADTDTFDLQDKLTDEILYHAEIMKFDSYNELKNYLATTNHTNATAWNYIFEADGRQYIFRTANIITEVNYFRDRIVNESNNNIDVELKFVPCNYKTVSIRCCNFDTDPNGVYLDTVTRYEDKIILSRPDRANFDWYTQELQLTNKKTQRLYEMVFNNAEIPSKEAVQDLCYIAIHNNVVSGAVWPKALVHDVAKSIGESAVNMWGDLEYQDKGISLSLIPLEGTRNLASETISTQTAKINTATKYCFKFISDNIPDTNSIFIIDNKKYLCEKLELTCNEHGIDKLFTGSFFVIED